MSFVFVLFLEKRGEQREGRKIKWVNWEWVSDGKDREINLEREER